LEDVLIAHFHPSSPSAKCSSNLLYILHQEARLY
jgi:hypothetical protein